MKKKGVSAKTEGETISPDREMNIREYLQGWKARSGTSSVYAKIIDHNRKNDQFPEKE